MDFHITAVIGVEITQQVLDRILEQLDFIALHGTGNIEDQDNIIILVDVLQAGSANIANQDILRQCTGDRAVIVTDFIGNRRRIGVIDILADDEDRIDTLQRQCRRTGVAVAVLQRIGEFIRAAITARRTIGRGMNIMKQL